MVDVASPKKSNGPSSAVDSQTGPTIAAASDSPAALPDNAAWMDAFKSAEMARRVEHIQAGRLVTLADLALMLGIGTQSVIKAERAGRFFCVSGPGDITLYPAFYADPHLARSVLEQVTRTLGDGMPGTRKWAFFTTPKTSLQGLTPIDALAIGRVGDVLRAATGEAGR